VIKTKYQQNTGTACNSKSITAVSGLSTVYQGSAHSLTLSI